MKSLLAFALLLFLLIGPAPRAHALRGELAQPSLAFPEGFDQAGRGGGLRALREEEATFLGGSVINARWVQIRVKVDPPRIDPEALTLPVFRTGGGRRDVAPANGRGASVENTRGPEATGGR